VNELRHNIKLDKSFTKPSDKSKIDEIDQFLDIPNEKDREEQE